MDSIMHYVATHKLALWVAVFIALFIVFFLFKKFLKLVLFLLLLLLILVGYMYFKDPKKVPENVLGALQKARQQTGKVVEGGKSVYEKGKMIVEKGQKLTKEEGKNPGDSKTATKQR